MSACVVQRGVDHADAVERTRALEATTHKARTALERGQGVPLEDALVCAACDGPLGDEREVCGACVKLVQLESAQLFEALGCLHALGSQAHIEEAKQSLRLLYASISLGTNADRIANLLGLNRSACRHYAMRFRAARIWKGPDVEGPWRSRAWLSPSFCRLMLMDALVGAGFAVRGKDRWEFLDEVAA